MITELTPDQAARLPLFRAEYYRHGISTEPADRPRAEAAFARAYRAIGREPVPTIWVDSPVTASLTMHLIPSLKDSLWASLETSLKDNLGASLGASLWASLGASLKTSLRDSLWDSLRRSLGASLGDSLKASLWASLGDSLWDSLRRSLGASLGASLGGSLQISPQYTYWWGQHDLYWIAFYVFCADVLGVQYRSDAADRLDIMHEIGLSCMWWYPRDGLIIACERPESIRVDSRERLHCESGPAIRFRDSWAVYAVHGVRVPAAIIEHPETITVAAIEAETNTEIQRVMIERFGWDRYAAECGADIIDHDERWGTLYGREGAALFVRVTNGSAESDGSFRQYVLPVCGQCEPIPDPDDPAGELGEPQSLTALNAVASTYGMRGEEYAALSVRT